MDKRKNRSRMIIAIRIRNFEDCRGCSSNPIKLSKIPPKNSIEMENS
jgi:hypothetical protein